MLKKRLVIGVSSTSDLKPADINENLAQYFLPQEYSIVRFRGSGEPETLCRKLRRRNKKAVVCVAVVGGPIDLLYQNRGQTTEMGIGAQIDSPELEKPQFIVLKPDPIFRAQQHYKILHPNLLIEGELLEERPAVTVLVHALYDFGVRVVPCDEWRQ